MHVYRRDFLRATGFGAAATLSGCTAFGGQEDSRQVDGDLAGTWLSWGRTPSNKRRRPDGPTAAAEPDVRWRTPVDNRITGTPTVDDSRIYVTAVDGGVTALATEGGSVEWSRPDLPTVRSSPVVVGDGLILGTKNAVVRLSAATGVTEWRFPAGAQSYASSPFVDDAVAYVGAGTDLLAVAAADGSDQWRFSTGGQVTAPPSTDGTLIYVASTDGRVYAVDYTGELRWTFSTDSSIHTAPLVDSGTVYIGSFDGVVYAIDSTNGDQRWAKALGPVYASLALSKDCLVVPSFGNTTSRGVYGLRDGTVTWHRQPGSLGSRSSPAVGGGTAYIGHDNGHIYAIDVTDGTIRWAFDTGSAAVESSPSIVANAVIVGDDDGHVYALEP